MKKEQLVVVGEREINSYLKEGWVIIPSTFRLTSRNGVSLVEVAAVLERVVDSEGAN
jgi:hypothetical protein